MYQFIKPIPISFILFNSLTLNSKCKEKTKKKVRERKLVSKRKKKMLKCFCKCKYLLYNNKGKSF